MAGSRPPRRSCCSAACYPRSTTPRGPASSAPHSGGRGRRPAECGAGAHRPPRSRSRSACTPSGTPPTAPGCTPCSACPAARCWSPRSAWCSRRAARPRTRSAQRESNLGATHPNALGPTLSDMTPRLIRGAAAGAVAAALLLTGGGAGATPARASAVIAPFVSRYQSESSGPVAHATLSRVADDSRLLAAVRSGSDARVRRYVAGEFPAVWYHWHVSRLRIMRGDKTVVETGVPFVVDGPSTALRDAHGHAIARLQISIRDVIGFVRLNKRLDHVDTVVRGIGSPDVRTSLPAALEVKLPNSGKVTIAGRRYTV